MMSDINVFAIQQRLRAGAFVSVPRIQKTYGLNYCQAKRFLQNLIDRGWVEEKPKALRYRIRHDMLKLRRIRKEEVNDLLDAITSDAVNALDCVIHHPGAEFKTLEDAVRGKDDTVAAVTVLVERDLIYCYKEHFYPCVSGKTAKVLKDVAFAKERIASRNRMLKGEEDFSKLLVMFNVLFEDA